MPCFVPSSTHRPIDWICQRPISRNGWPRGSYPAPGIQGGERRHWCRAARCWARLGMAPRGTLSSVLLNQIDHPRRGISPDMMFHFRQVLGPEFFGTYAISTADEPQKLVMRALT
jgi:hypothetical protein